MIDSVNPFQLSVQEIEEKAIRIRENIVRMLLSAGAGHAASPLGMADVFATLYFSVLSHDSTNAQLPSRDRLVLSSGHICPVLYSTLAECGYFSTDELLTYMKFGSRLQGHPSINDLPFLESSSGPLAQGVSQAVGMAIALKHDVNDARVFCVSSDGEQNEGQVWEALMLANKYALENLTLIIDRNNIQIDGFTTQIMPIEPLRKKYESFGWHVIELDGNSVSELIDGFEARAHITDRPVCIIAYTTPGKGVDFMEKKFEWHGKAPNEAEAYQALLELHTMDGQIDHD
jgi:transketolase